MHPALALIIAAVIWGAAPPLFKYALIEVPPFTLAFIRFFVGGLVFLPFALKHWQKVSASQYRDIILGAFFGITINITFFFMGLELSPSINASVIGSLAPLFIYAFAIIILREKPHAEIMKGLLVSMLGGFVIVLMPLLGKKVPTASDVPISLQIIGNLYFVIATCGAVLHTIFNKKVLKKVNPYVVTLIGFWFSSATFFPFMVNELAAGKFQHMGLPTAVGVIYGALFSSALAYFLHSYGVARLPAQEAGVFGHIAPIVTVIVAIPVVGEYPDIYFVVGACLVFIGIMMSERHPHYRSAPKRLHHR